MLGSILVIAKWLIKGFVVLLLVDVALFAIIEVIKTIFRRKNKDDES